MYCIEPLVNYALVSSSIVAYLFRGQAAKKLVLSEMTSIFGLINIAQAPSVEAVLTKTFDRDSKSISIMNSSPLL